MSQVCCAAAESLCDMFRLRIPEHRGDRLYRHFVLTTYGRCVPGKCVCTRPQVGFGLVTQNNHSYDKKGQLTGRHIGTFQTAFRARRCIFFSSFVRPFRRLGSGSFRIYFVKMVARERKDFWFGFVFVCQASHVHLVGVTRFRAPTSGKYVVD